jgi:hypothetical protein
LCFSFEVFVLVLFLLSLSMCVWSHGRGGQATKKRRNNMKNNYKRWISCNPTPINMRCNIGLLSLLGAFNCSNGLLPSLGFSILVF